MAQTPILYAVRHGETSGNAAGTFRGSIDYPLDKNGKQDAQQLGDWFDGKKISAIYASSKTRAMDTAEAIAKPHQMDVTPLDSLHPINVGYLSGEPKDQHKNVMDYFDKNPNEKIPMGESINEFRARTQPPLKHLLAQSANAKHPVVVVAHSSIIHELNHIITGDHNQTLVKPGGIVGVYYHPQKGLALKALLKPEHKEETPYHG